MKKLSLIIPLLIASTLLTPLILHADTPISGCRFGSRIWTNPDMINSHPAYPAYFNYSNTADNGYSNFAGRCYAGGNSPCYIYASDGSLWHQGTLGDISFDNCPIDDYVPVIFIFTAGIALIHIRRHKSSFRT